MAAKKGNSLIQSYSLHQKPVYLTLIVLFLLALLLRILHLNTTFQSSDNCELADRIVHNRGYSWMLREYYGVLINVIVKIFAGVLSAIGFTITEFWWKFPIAFIGSLQVPLTFFFLKTLNSSNPFALIGSAMISILPIHVMQSRYLWGYEALGVFFVTLALYSVLKFFQQPSLLSGLKASFLTGLYLLSHGYIIPFLPCFILLLFLSPSEESSVFARLKNRTILVIKYFVWLFPLLFLPMSLYPLKHALNKPAQFGFFFLNHLAGFIGNIGYFLFGLLVLSSLFFIFAKTARSAQNLLLLLCGIFYLAPLIFGTPPGITVVRGYMLLGTYFLILFTLRAFESFSHYRYFFSLAILVITIFLTLWGTVETIFYRDQELDPAGVIQERGGTFPDPGTKAAGFLIQTQAPPEAKILALHRNVEPPNLSYYFRREEVAFYDLELEDSESMFSQFKNTADIVICERSQLTIIEKSNEFILRMVFYSENVPRMWIFARKNISLPKIRADVSQFNKAFDHEFSWKVSLW